MNDQVRLGPAGQEDLAVIERLTGDPEATGEHSWHGWFEPRWFRRRWEETGLLTEDGGTLMVVRRSERLGFVSWRRQETARTSYCWNVGIAMLPEVRGMGYGTEAQRLLVDYLFAHTQVNRVEAITEVTNTAEQRALEKAGFPVRVCCAGTAFATASGATGSSTACCATRPRIDPRHRMLHRAVPPPRPRRRDLPRRGGIGNLLRPPSTIDV
jgi:RimJ/RimL family protein N-acetyltransferase